MKHEITITIDTDSLQSYTDQHLASLWHVAQANPVDGFENSEPGDRWKDALCPGCGEPASGLGSVGGWLFVCHPCGDARWGHPQVSYGEGGAAGLLHDARIEYRKAMHEAAVRRLIGA